MHTLFLLPFLPIMLCVNTIIISNIFDSQLDSKQTFLLFYAFAVIFCGISYFFYTYIYLFIKVLFKRKEEAVIINEKGIYRSKWYIFSKPIFIDWNNIDVYTSVYHYISRTSSSGMPWLVFNNNSICLTLKKEFYDNLSVMEKIACTLTCLTSNGHHFRIRLFFTKDDATKVVDKMKEYSPQK